MNFQKLKFNSKPKKKIEKKFKIFKKNSKKKRII
jgi:hypothetical protein